MQNKLSESVPSYNPRQRKEFIPIKHTDSDCTELIEKHPTKVKSEQQAKFSLRYVFTYQW